MKDFKQDLTIGIIVCIAGALLFWNTFTFPPPLQPDAPGAATFPRIIIGVMMLFGILLIYNSLSGKIKAGTAAKVAILNRKFLSAVGLIVLYLALLPYLGFVWDSFLYLAVTLFARIRGRLKPIVVAAIGVACFYLIFEVILDIRLPRFYLSWLIQ